VPNDSETALALMAGTAGGMTIFTLRVPPPLLQRITAKAARINAHRSQLARHLLQLGLEQLENTTFASHPDGQA
jgi:hypothetical protein